MCVCSIEQRDAAHQTLVQGRNLPCLICGCRHLLMLPAVTVRRLGCVFLAGGWHLCARIRASGQNNSISCGPRHTSVAPVPDDLAEFLWRSLWRVSGILGRSLCKALSPCRYDQPTTPLMSVTRLAGSRFPPCGSGNLGTEQANVGASAQCNCQTLPSGAM